MSGRRYRAKGQNLVELGLTLPFVLIFIFLIIELGRVWYCYNGAKMAAEEGVYTAAIYHNPASGQQQMLARLQLAQLQVVSATVTALPNQHAYQGNVTVQFSPMFAGLSIPTVSGPIQIFPAAWPVSYQAVNTPAIY